MTTPEIIKAVAELDGWNSTQYLVDSKETVSFEERLENEPGFVPDYLHSYDAIIPVIEKQFCGDESGEAEFIHWLSVAINSGFIKSKLISFSLLVATPLQLCEALLRSVGKWKD